MAVEDYLKEIKDGTDESIPEFDIEYFEGKDFEVSTIKGQSCHLCGYDLFFGFKMVKRPNGPSEKVPCRYTLNATDFPAWEGDKNGQIRQNHKKSVLPEIMFKLVRAKIVGNIMGTVIKKSESKSKK